MAFKSSASRITSVSKSAVKTKATRREKVAAKEEAIISAAYDIIAEKGFARTTMVEIARSAGVAEGTVYLYFENKEALAEAVLAAFYTGLTQGAVAGVKRRKGLRDKLKFLAKHHLDNIIRERAVLALLSVSNRDDAQSYAKSPLYALNRDYVAVFDAVVEEGVGAGEISAARRLWVMRDVFFGGLEYAMRTLTLGKRKNGVEEAVAGIVDLIAPELGPAPAIASPSPTRESAVTDRLEAVAARLERLAGKGA